MKAAHNKMWGTDKKLIILEDNNQARVTLLVRSTYHMAKKSLNAEDDQVGVKGDMD